MPMHFILAKQEQLWCQGCQSWGLLDIRRYAAQHGKYTIYCPSCKHESPVPASIESDFARLNGIPHGQLALPFPGD